MQRYIILSFGKIRLCTETICGVPFGVLILGDSRETAKSGNHSSSNILAVYKRLKTEICRNLTNSHNPKKNTGAFSPESRESIKTNELQRDSAQRFTMALRAVFSPHRAVLSAPASHGPKCKPIPISHADFLPTPHTTRSPID